MVLKIINDSDVEMMKQNQAAYDIDKVIVDRVEEIISMLDDAYGTDRAESDQGGIIMLFTKLEDYIKKRDRIMSRYYLRESDYEYSDEFWGDSDKKTCWTERLYLRSSEDALVLIYANN